MSEDRRDMTLRQIDHLMRSGVQKDFDDLWERIEESNKIIYHLRSVNETLRQIVIASLVVIIVLAVWLIIVLAH